MNMTTRELQTTYDDVLFDDGTCDVTVEITEDAEDALFAAFDMYISDEIHSGYFPTQELHLFRRITEQRSEHPPWIEVSDTDVRVYDLELSKWDYEILTDIVGLSLSNVLSPGGAEKYEALLDVWTSISEQIRTQQQDATAVDTTPIDEMTFQCLLQGTAVKMYKDTASGDKAFMCTECDTVFYETQAVAEHEC